MLSLFFKPLRQGVRVLTANEAPRQIAAGVAIGVLLGLVPKGNLIAIALLIALLSLRVNKSAGLATAGLFSMIGLWIDPFCDRLGAKVLAVADFQPTYAWLYDLPLGPWIGFHNTVVCGALLVGIYVAYPAYLVSHLLLQKFAGPLSKWLMRYRIARALLGLDVSSRLGGLGLGGGS